MKYIKHNIDIKISILETIKQRKMMPTKLSLIGVNLTEKEDIGEV